MNAEERSRRLALWLLNLDELEGWYGQRVLNGFTLSRKDGGWLLVVRAASRKGERLVCFSWALSIEGAVYQFVYGETHDPGNVWREDRYTH